MKQYTLTLSNWFNFEEVWKITQWKDGMILKTTTTNKFIPIKDKNKLERKLYITSSLSTTLISKLNKGKPVSVAIFNTESIS